MIDVANGWKEWSKHVLLTLESQNKEIDEIQKTCTDIRLAIRDLQNDLKMKARLWKAAMAMVPIGLTGITLILKFG